MIHGCDHGRPWTQQCGRCSDETAARIRQPRFKVYVASAWSDYRRTRAAHHKLRESGIVITHDWTQDVDRYPTDHAPEDVARSNAQLDLDGVIAADALLVLVPSERTLGCGVWHEAGAALALGKLVVYSGAEHNTRTIFQLLADYTTDSDEDAIKWLIASACVLFDPTGMEARAVQSDSGETP